MCNDKFFVDPNSKIINGSFRASWFLIYMLNNFILKFIDFCDITSSIPIKIYHQSSDSPRWHQWMFRHSYKGVHQAFSLGQMHGALEKIYFSQFSIFSDFYFSLIFALNLQCENWWKFYLYRCSQMKVKYSPKDWQILYSEVHHFRRRVRSLHSPNPAKHPVQNPFPIASTLASRYSNPEDCVIGFKGICQVFQPSCHCWRAERRVVARSSSCSRISDSTPSTSECWWPTSSGGLSAEGRKQADAEWTKKYEKSPLFGPTLR